MPKQRITINTQPEIKKLKRGYSVRFRTPPHDGKAWGYSKAKKYPDAKTIGEARRLAEEYREELEDEINDYTVKESITFGEYARRWHEDRKDTGELLPYSYDREELFIRKLEKTKLAAIELQDITAEDIDELKKELGKYSKSEQSKIFNKVKQILRFAESRRRIKYDPSKIIKNVKAEPQKRRMLTEEEQTKLFDLLFEYENNVFINLDGKHAAIAIALSTGLRLGEVLGLIWADIDPKKQTLKIERQLGRKKEIKPPKYNSIGIIPLDTITLEYLRQWKHRTKKLAGRTGEELENTPICCNEHFEYYLQSNFSRWYRRFMADNGFGGQEITKAKDSKGYPRTHRTKYNGPKFHELRHTAASALLSGGADLQTVKTLMRHSRITTTEQYLHDIPTNLREAVQNAQFRRIQQSWGIEEANSNSKTRLKWD